MLLHLNGYSTPNWHRMRTMPVKCRNWLPLAAAPVPLYTEKRCDCCRTVLTGWRINGDTLTSYFGQQRQWYRQQIIFIFWEQHQYWCRKQWCPGSRCTGRYDLAILQKQQGLSAANCTAGLCITKLTIPLKQTLCPAGWFAAHQQLRNKTCTGHIAEGGAG